MKIGFIGKQIGLSKIYKLRFDYTGYKLSYLISASVFILALAINKDATPGENSSDVARPASINGNVSSIYGAWKGGDTATEAVYGTMTITPTRISWKSNNNDPKCTTNYHVQTERPGVFFRHAMDDKYVTTADADLRYRTFLLKLHQKSCVLSVSYIRITIDERLPGYFDFVEYQGATPDAVGYGHFHFVNHLEK